jgi:hypothetical protein
LRRPPTRCLLKIQIDATVTQAAPQRDPVFGAICDAALELLVAIALAVDGFTEIFAIEQPAAA